MDLQVQMEFVLLHKKNQIVGLTVAIIFKYKMSYIMDGDSKKWMVVNPLINNGLFRT